MARVALCISGAFRGEDFIENLKNIIKEFKLLEVDVFIHSWDSYKIWYGLGGLGRGWIRNWYSENIIKYAPKELIGDNLNFKNICPSIYEILEKEVDCYINGNILKTIKQLPNVKSVKLSNEKEYFRKYQSNLEIVNSAKMFYGFWQVCKLLLDYEKRNNFYYDYIIILRPDKKYFRKFDLEFIKKLQDNEIVYEGSNRAAGDTWFYGKRYAMVEFLSSFEKANKYKHLIFFKYFPQGICCAPIGYLSHHILSNYIPFIGLKSNYANNLKYLNIFNNPKIPNIKKALLNDLSNLKQHKHKEYILFFDILNCNKILKSQNAIRRIQNQLSYKLGQAMILNSKSILGYLKMPYTLYSIKKQHNIEQIAYNKIIKDNPNLKLPPLESYPDYQEALKCKNHLSYKLGEALIKANNKGFITGGGGYWLLFEISCIIKQHKNKKAKNENR